jgi:hypothetical protein
MLSQIVLMTTLQRTNDFITLLSFTQTENKDKPEEAIDALIPDKISNFK